MYTFDEFKEQLKFNVDMVYWDIEHNQDVAKNLYSIYQAGWFDGKDEGIKQSFELIRKLDL